MSLDDLSIIRDQRVMVGRGQHDSVEAIERAWQEWVNDPGHVLATRLRRGDSSRDLRESSQVVQAYISGGKWVADCPFCNGGIAAWIENPRGVCLDCGMIYRVEHPDRDEAEQAIAVLAKRPDPRTRSWHRHRGETIDDLVRENDVHLTVETTPSGVVAVDEVARVLGKRALAKLQAEGVV